MDYTLQQSALPVQYRIFKPASSESYTVTTGRIYLPLTAGVRLWQGLSLHTGIQMGLGLHSNKVDIDGSMSGKTIAKHKFDPVHWYLPVGLSYEYCHWVADLRYYYSLKKNHWNVEAQRGGIFEWAEY